VRHLGITSWFRASQTRIERKKRTPGTIEHGIETRRSGNTFANVWRGNDIGGDPNKNQGGIEAEKFRALVPIWVTTEVGWKGESLTKER
jgi:hypothetical protein